MPRSEDDVEESVDEDVELELSCALHDLAEQVKTFEERMRTRLKIPGMDDEEDEITEDIPEASEEDPMQAKYGYDSPSKADAKLQRTDSRRTFQYAEDDQDEEDSDTDAKRSAHSNNRRNEWDEQTEHQQLCSLQSNIAKLLQGIQEQAHALDAANQ